ncbi:aspartyl/asparaginyl beta-hydroxylase domain-containing protein [Sphingobium sp. MK2]|uniref:aspartyl/asparaginyl beta-hydroxylase domain-containing protein n=1 Tax=Sphingobium sp. MK2 TaxID=3116540 RepID=UPI0032E36194
MDIAVSRLLQQAAQARQSGWVAQGEQLLAQVLRLAPKEPQALNLAGLLALDKGEFKSARDYFLAATAADPGEAALWMNLAAAERGLNHRDAERSALQAAIDIDQRNLMAQIRMAQLLQRLGEGQGAVESWGKALALSAGTLDLPPALADMLAKGRDYVCEHQADFAKRIETGVADLLDQADPTARRRFQACLDREFGRRTIYQNQCSGLHYPFLPAEEYFDRHHFPWMEALEAQTDIIRAEFLAMLAGVDGAVRPYVRQEPGTPQNKWTMLHDSLDWGAAFLWEYGVRNEAVCAACPQTVAALEALPRADIAGRAPSAFFSLLRPKSRIPAHTGVTNSRAIIHLPLIVPPDCYFRVGGETRNWQEGVAFAFDDTIEHEAWNESDHLRVVLIFDVWNPHLSLAEQQLLKQFYAAVDARKMTDTMLDI